MSITYDKNNGYDYNDIHDDILILEDCSLQVLYYYIYELYQNKYDLNIKITTVENVIVSYKYGFELLQYIKNITSLREQLLTNDIVDLEKKYMLFAEIITLANKCEVILHCKNNSLLSVNELMYLKYDGFSKFITKIKENIMECKWFY